MNPHPVLESIVILNQSIVKDCVLSERGGKRIGQDYTKSSQHIVKGLAHSFRVRDSNKFRLDFGLDKSVEPAVFYLAIQFLKVVLDLGLTKNILNFVGLFSNLSIQELIQSELLFYQIEVRILFQD